MLSIRHASEHSKLGWNSNTGQQEREQSSCNLCTSGPTGEWKLQRFEFVFNSSMRASTGPPAHCGRVTSPHNDLLNSHTAKIIPYVDSVLGNLQDMVLVKWVEYLRSHTSLQLCGGMSTKCKGWQGVKGASVCVQVCTYRSCCIGYHFHVVWALKRGCRRTCIW